MKESGMVKSISVAILCVLVVPALLAGSKGKSIVFLNQSSLQQSLTGNLQIDFFSQRLNISETMQLQSDSQPVEVSRKSPWLAAGLSALLPGAGEFYAESYWKAAAFLAIDIAAWGLAYHFDKKGDRQTDFFQNYANQNWDPEKYAQFSFDHYLTTQQKDDFRNRLFQPGATPRERVNWNVLNEMERVISATAEGRFYSHTLPPFGDQQYYELIGKYQQFYQGWNDADPSLTTYALIEAKIKNDPTNFKYYSLERGKANDFYTTATTYVTIAIVNHVLSAVDAAWTAASYNRNLHASVRMQQVPTYRGYALIPVARVEYSF